jgi:hypothetical protein
VVPDEDRARVADARDERLGILDGELEVLRGDAVRELARFGEVARADERPAVRSPRRR